MPDEPEALGLLALMLFHDSRRAARLTTGGELVLLHEQDLLRRLGRAAEAAAAYRRALALTTSGPERAFLERRLGEITG